MYWHLTEWRTCEGRFLARIWWSKMSSQSFVGDEIRALSALT